MANAWDALPPGSRCRYCGGVGNLQWSSYAGPHGGYVCDRDECHDAAEDESRELDEEGRDG